LWAHFLIFAQGKQGAGKTPIIMGVSKLDSFRLEYLLVGVKVIRLATKGDKILLTTDKTREKLLRFTDNRQSIMKF